MTDCDIIIFRENVGTLAALINQEYQFLYGVPRGGIYVAMELSKLTKIPLIDKLPIFADSSILIVDDLIDSGRTRTRYAEYDFACLHIKPHSPKEGKIYYTLILNDWISYWWEKSDNGSTIEDNIARILQLAGEEPGQIILEDPIAFAKIFSKFYWELSKVGYNRA